MPEPDLRKSCCCFTAWHHGAMPQSPFCIAARRQATRIVCFSDCYYLYSLLRFYYVASSITHT
ncbi:hypothetical protein APV28_2693 [Comamonas testosteroni]|nr:hypothetical protein APV28_2693 [Comamonas testosteroni]